MCPSRITSEPSAGGSLRNKPEPAYRYAKDALISIGGMERRRDVKFDLCDSGRFGRHRPAQLLAARRGELMISQQSAIQHNARIYRREIPNLLRNDARRDFEDLG